MFCSAGDMGEKWEILCNTSAYPYDPLKDVFLNSCAGGNPTTEAAAVEGHACLLWRFLFTSSKVLKTTRSGHLYIAAFALLWKWAAQSCEADFKRVTMKRKKDIELNSAAFSFSLPLKVRSHCQKSSLLLDPLIRYCFFWISYNFLHLN